MIINLIVNDIFGHMEFYPIGMEDNRDEIIKELSEILEPEGMQKIDNPILFLEQNKWFEKKQDYYALQHYAKCMWTYKHMFVVVYTKRFTIFRTSPIPIKNMTPEQHKEWEDSLDFMNDLYEFFWKTYYQPGDFND